MKRKAFVSGPIQGMETRQSYRDVIREICIARAKAMEYANGIPCLNAWLSLLEDYCVVLRIRG